MSSASTAPVPDHGSGRHHHIPELQSVRGLASLVVVLHHCSFAFYGPGTFNLIAQAVLNAHAAVVLFYVLSGYVLTRSLLGSKLTFEAMGRFYLARAFRIYPALWAALFIAALYYLAHANNYHPDGLSDWARGISDHLPWKRFFAKGALGIDWSILPTSWSIYVELQGSILIPFIAIIVRRGVISWVIMQVILIAMAWTDWPTPFTEYIQAFGAGAGICLFTPAIRYLSNTAARVITYSALLFLLFFRLTSPDWRFLVGYGAIVPTIVEAIGAAVFLGVIISNSAVAPFLKNRLLIRLGDISYSLYLVHLIIIFSILKVMLNIYPTLAVNHPLIATGSLMIFCLIISIPVSSLLYSYIEIPGIALGKRVLATVSRPTVISYR